MSMWNRLGDMRRRGAGFKGKTNPKRVPHIKWRLKQGHDKKEIAEDEELDVETIRAIARGDRYAVIQAKEDG